MDSSSRKTEYIMKIIWRFVPVLFTIFAFVAIMVFINYFEFIDNIGPITYLGPILIGLVMVGLLIEAIIFAIKQHRIYTQEVTNQYDYLDVD